MNIEELIVKYRKCYEDAHTIIEAALFLGVIEDLERLIEDNE
jgi:hypothetical protein